MERRLSSMATTVEEPLTPAMRSLLVGRAQVTRLVSYAFALVCAVVGTWLTLLIATSPSDGGPGYLLFAGGFGLGTVFCTWLLWLIGHRTWQRASRDVEAGVYLKIIGPVRVSTETHNNPNGPDYETHTLSIGGRTLSVSDYIAFALEDQSWATITCAKYSAMAFEARALDGTLLYRDSRL
jgi:hypothetical protein